MCLKFYLIGGNKKNETAIAALLILFFLKVERKSQNVSVYLHIPFHPHFARIPSHSHRYKFPRGFYILHFYRDLIALYIRRYLTKRKQPLLHRGKSELKKFEIYWRKAKPETFSNPSTIWRFQELFQPQIVVYCHSVTHLISFLLISIDTYYLAF